MVRNRLWMFIRKKTIRDYDCMNADTRQWEIGSAPGDNLEFSKETRSVVTKRERSGAYIQQDLFPNVEYTNRWPSQLLDRLISIFSIPDPAIVVLDCFVWVPTFVLGILIGGLANSSYNKYSHPGRRFWRSWCFSQLFLVCRTTILMDVISTVPRLNLPTHREEWYECPSYRIFQLTPLVQPLFHCSHHRSQPGLLSRKSPKWVVHILRTHFSSTFQFLVT